MTWPFAVKPFASLELGLHQSEVTPRVIGTAGEDASAVGCDRDGSNRPRVALEGAPASPVGRPPHANAIVPAALRIAPARGRPVAPRGTGDAPDDIVMTGEAADFLSRLQLQSHHDWGVACREDVVAVRREGNAPV